MGRVRGAGRARQPPGAAGAPLPTKGPSAAAGLHDIRQPATPSLLNLLLPAPLPAPRRPRGKTHRFGKAGKRRDAGATLPRWRFVRGRAAQGTAGARQSLQSASLHSPLRGCSNTAPGAGRGNPRAMPICNPAQKRRGRCSSFPGILS